ncbi:hypothetical protein DOTSEDRAFT_27263 [Dothistroma septosporum NZE10]|uniref:Uncharacterized protein n=1 Tax=Dothistroma septosporum (strain NZE10 / CBS 128990) TaxID=675120 RepID=N1PGG0_DOTSN|nr:hypothetical protein DOTSEDRAFT_27263 [Dothistroma septosporum NZE10]
MTRVKSTRRVYSAEELHRLRGSQSQPKLKEAIEEKDGEDAEIVKEHVLRGSRSFAARSYRSRASGNSLRVPSNKSNNENLPADVSEGEGKANNLQPPPNGLALGEIVPNGQTLRPGPFKLRPSPTPSLKRKKAEAIVKAHGSPTHVRVTAGGRIVPSEQSPLCHPRFGYSAIQANGGLIKSVAPNHQAGKPQWTRATENGFVAQDIEGNLCQIVDGTIMPLQEVNGALQLYIEAPNIHGSSHGQFNAAIASHRLQQQTTLRSAGVVAPEPNPASQITALELEYAKLEHELKDVDKTEVIHGRGMGKGFKDGLVVRRRELVTNMDKIRKALKVLRNQPPPNAPASPRAMVNRQSISPPRRGLGALSASFHTQRPLQICPGPIAPPNAHGPYMPSAAFAPQFAASSTEEVYTGQRWDVPPAGIFMQPPPFDGSMGPPVPMMPPLSHAPLPHDAPPVNQTHQAESIPQHDGSLVDVRIQTPNLNHAVSIRAPESKATNIKSILNPMSPAYKPAATNTSANEHGGAVTSSAPRFPVHLQSGAQRSSAGTDDTISPAKKVVHMHSSSIASFNTADFFPRNTGEYSTRQQEYQDDKEPANAYSARDNTAGTPGHQDLSPLHFRAPAVPPGTPVDSARKISQTLNLPRQRNDVPDRDAHNISPKSKREWLFVQDRPAESQALSYSSSPTDHSTRPADLDTGSNSSDTLDLLDKPREWIEGFQAGLQRKHIGDRAGDSLNGYVAGLLKSTPLATGSGPKTFTGSPVRPTSRRPSPVLPSRSASRLAMTRKAPSTRQPFEMNMQSLDTLKQAAYAPQNEHAILTPAPNGPHVNGMPRDFGTWAKDHKVQHTTESNNSARITDVPNFPVPSRTSSVQEHQNVKVTGMGDSKQHSQIKELPAIPDRYRSNDNTGAFLQPIRGQFSAGLMPPTSPTLSTMSIASSSIATGSAPNTGRRVTSISSMDSSTQHQWPGSRIMTPSDWKSGSSIAHAAGLATGFFAHAQFDGSQDNKAPLHRPGQLVDMSIKDYLQPSYRVTSITSARSSGSKHDKLHEGFLDGMSSPPRSPPRSPSPNMSPNVTPRATPRDNGKKHSSPVKGASPAKAQFQSIAEKVGIKVATTTNSKSPDAASGPAAWEGGSPSGKRRWRDVWRKGGRDGSD